MKIVSVKKILSLLICLILFGRVSGQCSEYDMINLRKTAIVFGERDYKYAGALVNPLNDAGDISDSLKKEGFNVVTLNNADFNTMSTAIDNWCSNLSKYDVALFYYSGHGAEVNGINYLFPIDADPKGPSDLYYSAYSANKILDRMETNNAKYNIMILDACRNNPFTKKWSKGLGTTGLASMAGRGSFIGFAAAPGTTASDGLNRNGLYTEAILKYIMVPDLTIDQIFTKVNAYVREKSGDQQVPYKNSSLSTDFCFNILHKISLKPLKQSSFVQPASQIVCTNYNQLFSIDEPGNSLSNRNAEAVNVANIPLPNGLKPYKLVSAVNELAFIDTSSKALIVYDNSSKEVTSNIRLQGVPLSITITPDVKTIYVGITQNNDKGAIQIISQAENKIKKTIPLESVPKSLILSNNGRYLYLILQGQVNLLTILDTKTEKIVRTFPLNEIINEIGISPNDKYLFILKQKGIDIMDANSFQIMDTLNCSANSIAFSYDDKYAFANSKSEVVIINLIEKKIVNIYPFTTSPDGVAVSNDNRAFVWLPQENRTFVIDINQILEKGIVNDPESNLKIFQEELKNNPTITELSMARELFSQTFNVYRQEVKKLTKELGNPYETIQTGYGDDFKNLISKQKIGIISAFDNNKSIWPIYTLKLTPQYYLLSIKQDSDKQEEIFKSALDNVNWDDMKRFVRNYFLKRLNQLK